jgi:hypothetical protein
VSISADGIREIADLNGQVLYGMDEQTMAFFQTPAIGFTNASRLLIIDRKTLAIVADKIVKGFQNGFYPTMMKWGFVDRLAVRSKDSTVYIPLFDGHRFNSFDVAEANWITGEARQLSVPAAKGAERWEITALYSVLSGIAVERGPFLTLFNPATQTVVLTLNNSGRDLRPAGTYYAVPDYGIVESAKGMFQRITEKNFSTLISSPEAFPSSQINIDQHHRRIAQTIQGKPCLIWGENKAGVTNSNPFETRSISEIVVYDVGAKKEMLRKPLGTDFSPEFLTDSTGHNIYFLNLQATEIFRLNLESQNITSFAKWGTNRLSWVAAN